MLPEPWKKSSWPFLRNRVRGEGQRSKGGITYSGSWIGLSFLALKLIIHPFSAMHTSEKQEFDYTVSYLGGNIHWWLASTMEILREFLESSTIHGLTYISTAQVFAVFPIFSMPSFRPDQPSFCGLSLSVLGLLVLESWLASLIMSGRSLQLPPQSRPTPSRTSTFP